MTVFIGGAWPYANGSLHLGHLVALLPGDVLARYYRLKGEDVLYVSGSDCNGTPIAIRARQENVDAQTIADRYHQEFVNDFKRLGFTYDLYTRTDASFHHEIVQKIFLKLKEKGYLYTLLGLGDPTWAPVFIPKDSQLDDVKPLFERIDTSRIDEEKGKLGVRA